MTTEAERPVIDWTAQKTVVDLIEQAKWAMTEWELRRRLSQVLDEVQRQHGDRTNVLRPQNKIIGRNNRSAKV